MSADLLREAAALMRDRAEAATPGPWLVAEQTHGAWYGLQSQWTALGNVFEKGEGDHIASWHPAVAVAVADMLDALALDREMDPYLSKHFDEASLAVARAYLGQESA